MLGSTPDSPKSASGDGDTISPHRQSREVVVDKHSSEELNLNRIPCTSESTLEDGVSSNMVVVAESDASMLVTGPLPSASSDVSTKETEKFPDAAKTTQQGEVRTDIKAVGVEDDNGVDDDVQEKPSTNGSVSSSVGTESTFLPEEKDVKATEEERSEILAEESTLPKRSSRSKRTIQPSQANKTIKTTSKLKGTEEENVPEKAKVAAKQSSRAPRRSSTNVVEEDVEGNEEPMNTDVASGTEMSNANAKEPSRRSSRRQKQQKDQSLDTSTNIEDNVGVKRTKRMLSSSSASSTSAVREKDMDESPPTAPIPGRKKGESILTAVKKMNKKAEGDIDDDDILNYTPLKNRPLATGTTPQGAIPFPLSREQSTPIPETPAVEPLSDVETVMLKALMDVDDPNDVRLGPVKVMWSRSKLKCKWPVRVISSLSGLSTATLDQLKKDKFLDGMNIKEGVKLVAYVGQGPRERWYLMDITLTEARYVAFEDDKARKEIEKELSNKKQLKERDELRYAMEMAQKMYDTACKKKLLLPAVPGLSETKSDLAELPSPEDKHIIPSLVQLQGHEIIPVEFKPGLAVTVDLPNQGRISTVVVEIVQLGSGQYQVVLKDGTTLTDDIPMCAGKNKIFFNYSDFKNISTFVVGKEGTHLGERLAEMREESTKKGLEILFGEREGQE